MNSNEQMTAKLAQYMQENGYYDTRAIARDFDVEDDDELGLGASWMSWFGTDGEEDVQGEYSEEFKFADAYNDEKANAEIAARKQAVEEILTHDELSADDWQALEAAGATRENYDNHPSDFAGYDLQLKPEYARRRTMLLAPATGETILAKAAEYGEKFPDNVKVIWHKWNDKDCRIIGLHSVKQHTCYAIFEDGSEHCMNPLQDVEITIGE